MLWLCVQESAQQEKATAVTEQAAAMTKIRQLDPLLQAVAAVPWLAASEVWLAGRARGVHAVPVCVLPAGCATDALTSAVAFLGGCRTSRAGTGCRSSGPE